MRALNVLFLFFVFGFTAISYGQKELRIVAPDSSVDKRSEFYVTLLRLALEKTGGGTKVISTIPMEQERQIELISQNQQLDLMWTMTSKIRELKVKPIRIPLLKGLLGHRIFIIRKSDQDKFRSIETLDELKKFVAGQGMGWPDTAILQHNLGERAVVQASSYCYLFDMLQNHRFDYFPRGIHEPFDEIEPPGSAGYGKNFVVDDHILIRYTAPIFFFVNNRNIRLANRLEQGLRLAIQDGSFDRVFMRYMGSILKKAKLEDRIVFDFENPNLSSKTRELVKERSLWYSIAPTASLSK